MPFLLSFLLLHQQLSLTAEQKRGLLLMFVIHNDSLLPICSIKPQYLIRKLTTGPNSSIENAKIVIGPSLKPIPELEPDESATLAVLYSPFVFPTPITSADIDVDIAYRPQLLPWVQHKRMRFSTIKVPPDTTLYYLPKAFSE